MTRALRTLAALVLALGLLAACGDDDSDSSGADTEGAAETDDSQGGDDAGPVTIDHRYGSTTLEATPERIVSIDGQWTDVLTLMEAPLVGAALDPQVEGGRYPWQEVPDTVEDIVVTDAIPFESVAALNPDLIVITWAAADEGDYETLSQIAPTIPLLDDKEVATWQEIATTAGEVLGRPDDAAEIIADFEEWQTRVGQDLPGLEGKTFALANYVPGDSIYVVADPDDGASQLFYNMGLEIDPEIVELADGASGRTKISLENIELLDSDLLVILTNGTDTADIPGYDSLPAVQSGAVAVLDVATVTGLNTPSPQSLQYSVGVMEDALTAAANS